MSFFDTLNYSSCNEDWRTERRALRIGPDDRVLAVTGSGDRPLHLLLDAPASVVAVDANESQSELLRLKMASMASLPYDDYVAFLGLHPSDRRREVLRQVASDSFWFDRAECVEAGILYQGRWERYTQTVAFLARAMRGDAIRRLFEFRDLDEQRAFVRKTWNRWWWRATLDVLCSRITSKICLGDPAFYANVDPDLRVGRYIHEGMMAVLDRYLARENFMLSLLFQGRLPEGDLPPYLDAGSFEVLRNRLDRIEVRTSDLVDLLQRFPAGSFTRFSLSDVPSYLDPPKFERLLHEMIRVAAPGARFCIRQFLSGHRVPERFQNALRREPELEEDLRREDRAFAYRFLVGTVA